MNMTKFCNPNEAHNVMEEQPSPPVIIQTHTHNHAHMHTHWAWGWVAAWEWDRGCDCEQSLVPPDVLHRYKYEFGIIILF